MLTTGTQGEYRSALFRIAQGEHRLVDLREGDRVLMSSRWIPGNEKEVGRMINNLFKQGAEVLYEATHMIHVSGHATRPELKKMIEWTKPRFFMPIHGEYRHLVHHANVADRNRNEGREKFSSRRTATSFRSERIISRSCTGWTRSRARYIDGQVMNEITKDILKDRRKLARAGGVFVLHDSRSGYGKRRRGAGDRSPGNRDRGARGDADRKGAGARASPPPRIEAEGRTAESWTRSSRRRFGSRCAGSRHSIIGKKPVVIPFILDL